MLPKAPSIVASFVCAFLSLFLGFAIFRKYQDNFVFYV
jgi:ABC-type polysaccharide/polyol phosphate export permease